MNRDFNTREYIKVLVKTGIKKNQAEAIVKGLVESRKCDFFIMAKNNKVDAISDSIRGHIEYLKDFINENIEAIKKELIADISGYQTNALRWVTSLLIVIIGLVTASIGIMITMMFKMLYH